MKIDQEILDSIEAELTKEIRSREDYIMNKIRRRLGYESYSFQRFNGLFGGKNNTYVNSVKTQFTDFNDFYSQWLKGVSNQYEERLKFGAQPNHNAVLLKDSELEEFVRLFLERNFYRNLKARTRSKPDEQLWSVWFGYQVIFGLLIAPVYVGSKWIIDKSEMRRATYEYWTIGHVFNEGLINNSSNRPFKIKTMEQFEDVYIAIFQQLSNSLYEKKIFDKYIEYLKLSSDLESEPLLIPEIRYAGLERDHIYRLDFTILNSHTQQYVGFEISPSSSHMSINGYREKQKEVNTELSEKWNYEMKKRNDYFKLFEITTITFTERMLENFDECWFTIKEFLGARSEKKTSIQEQLKRIRNI